MAIGSDPSNEFVIDEPRAASAHGTLHVRVFELEWTHAVSSQNHAPSVPDDGLIFTRVKTALLVIDGFPVP